MNRKKAAIILIISLVILVIIMVAINILTPKENLKEAYLKDAVQVTTDKDTGEQIIVDPNLGAQTDEKKAVIVLGLEPVIKEGALGEQVDLIKYSIGVFSETRLKNKYTTITLRPQDLVTTNGVTIASIRLGQSDEILPITITAKNTGETQVVIDDPLNKYGGKYDSGLTVFGAD